MWLTSTSKRKELGTSCAYFEYCLIILISVRHGFNKKLVRGAHQIKQVTGLTTDVTVDEKFEELFDQFEKYQRLVVVLQEDVQKMVSSIRGIAPRALQP